MKNRIIPLIFFAILIGGIVAIGIALYQKNAPSPTNNERPGIVDQDQDGVEQCLITVYGLTYDVEPLRLKHPGGDIFVCGTDMSDTFRGKHGTNAERIKPYLVK